MECILSESIGRKGPSAGDKSRYNFTNTAQSKATQSTAKPNQKPKTHSRGSKQALTTSAKERARPRIGVWPEARLRCSVVVYFYKCMFATLPV
jgi:hypothetical protein